jgi:hypothetical protein
MILTCYPQNWYGNSGKGKMHAFAWDGPVGDHGEPLFTNTITGKTSRLSMATSLCGQYMDASGNEFHKTEADTITCARCVRAANRLRAERKDESHVS